MQLSVNGKKAQYRAATVEALVAELGVDARQVAVEVNGVIVSKSAYGAARLVEGDVIEIVRFIGGG